MEPTRVGSDINQLHLQHYNARTVNAIYIHVLFSRLSTTPFLYGKIHCEALDLLSASIATFDSPDNFRLG